MAESWSRTITIEIGETSGVFTRIETTRDAAFFLLDHWQLSPSPCYCTAVRTCTKAMKGEMSHEAAYLSFMAAVREGSVPTISTRRDEKTDELESEISSAVAENILAELKALRSNAAHQPTEPHVWTFVSRLLIC